MGPGERPVCSGTPAVGLTPGCPRPTGSPVGAACASTSRYGAFGWGSGPGEDKSPEGLARRTGGKHAVKCDMCKGIDGGPACVRACPTGAAIRVDPSGFIDVMRRAEAEA